MRVFTLMLLMTFSQLSLADLEADLARLMQWFPGEYDNTEQHDADVAAGKEQVHEHIFHIFKPVSAPAIGPHAVFVKQYMDGNYEEVYRQRLYSFSADQATESVKLVIYSFKDEAKYRATDKDPSIISQITMEEVYTIPGCEVFWKWQGEHFVGHMVERACNFQSRRSGKRIFISDTLKLTDSEIWIADEAEDEDGNYVFGNKEGIPHKNVKRVSFAVAPK